MIWLIVIGSVAILFLMASFFGAPYVPTHKKRLVDAFEKLYPLSKSDTVVDVGSGDGVVLRYVAGKGSRAVGLEINPLLVMLSRMMSFGDSRVEVRLSNLWTSTLPDDVTVVYAFTVSRDIDRLIRKLQREANRLDRKIVFISYGIGSSRRKSDGLVGAHHRYDITPLQSEEA